LLLKIFKEKRSFVTILSIQYKGSVLEANISKHYCIFYLHS